MTPSPRPLNIMSDPRVFRGSVVAKQREEALRIRKEFELRDAEERYRMEVVRNRLNMALGVNGNPGGPSVGRTNTVASIRAETSARLAKLAGKTGKTAIAEWTETVENGIEKHSPRKQKPPRKLSPIRKEISPRISRTEKDVVPLTSTLGRNTQKTTFKNVRFVPLKSEPGVSSGPHKIVPSIPNQESFLAKRKRHEMGRKFVPSPFTPPQTPYGPRYYNDAAIQTDEAFEEAFAPIVAEMADTAISDALRNLRDEEDFKYIEEQNQKLLNIVVTQKRRNSELNLKILKHIRTEHELEKDRENAYKKLTALDCRRVAGDFVEKLIEECAENLANRGLIDDFSKYRSVAADTRQLEQQQKQLRAITLEIQRDFFPYVYAKAEQIFVHKLADSYLKDALFSKNAENRAEARSKLNEQIQKYQKLSRGMSLTNYGKKFGLS